MSTSLRGLGLTCDLRALPDEAMAQAGGKIAGLAKLLRAGVPVPPAQCFTGRAYEASATELARVVTTACAGLRRPLAVRSSAPGEDSSGASFAGQHETVLGVRTDDELLDAIRRVWASYSAASALAYRRERGVEAGPSAPWVLVQELVEADVAGVAFTRDPVDGSPHVVVDAVWGLADELVAGRAVPDHFVVDPATGTVLRSELAEREPCLEARDLAALLPLLEACERAIGCPVDVEFAFAGGRPWLLQARPITTAARGWRSELDSEVPERFPVFTRANASEVLPEVVTPLAHSVLFELGERAFQRSAIEMGAWRGPPDASQPFFQGCFYGRIVLNASTLVHCAAQLPGQDPQALGENYLGATRGRELTVAAGSTLRRLTRMPYVARVVASVPRRARRARCAVDGFFEGGVRDPAGLDRGELQPTLERARALAEDVLVVHLHASGLAGASYEALAKAITRWSGAPDPGLVARLCTGLQTLDSVLPTHALWRWSRDVLADPDQLELVETVEPRELERRLATHDTSASRKLREALDRFLALYGARGRDASSAWREDPAQVLEMLRAYTSLAAEQSPEEAAARQKRAREDATRALRAHLGPIRRLRLVMLLRAAHRFIALREELKGCTVRMTTHLRGIGLEGGRRLQAAGVLGSAGDAAFLTLGELVRTVETADAEDIRRRVARRRREYERNLSIELPETFTGRPEPARVGSAEPGDELRGIPVSPGRITGRARVVLDPSGVRIEAGEILVAPITDTGWTPLFAFAAGLVVDLGGQLSHGSIVAREFGLPAVVNVKSGTKDIATGDRITVDGDEGLVIVHREEAAT